MRNIFLKTLVIICCTGLINYLSGCKSDDDPSAEQLRLMELSASWGLGSINNEGKDVTNQFAGFGLTVEEFSFTTQNGGNAWAASGTYSFINDDLDRLVRNDGVEILINEINTDTLSLTFNVSEISSGGRLNGITGSFTFSLIKQ